MILFDDLERTSIKVALHNENAYNYYNQSARPDINIIRSTLNEWFSYYPNEEKNELKSRFKKDFDSSFYELYLFTLFRKLNFEITIHPVIPNTLKRPDFLIKKSDFEMYIEAKVVNDKSKQQEAYERKANEFYDCLGKVKIMNFYLGIHEINFKSNRQPSTKELIKKIESAVNDLDPEIVSNIISEKGTSYIPQITHEDDDLYIVIAFLPVRKEAMNKIIDRPIGMLPAEAWWGGSEEAIREAIIQKTKRYGSLDKPYIVAINALTHKAYSTTDMDNAILGSVGLSWYENLTGEHEKWMREKDGIFIDNIGPKLTNLTAVLITKIFPNNIPDAPYWLYEHPFSNNRANLDILNLITSRLENGKFVGKRGSNFGELLFVKNNWLGT